MQLETSISQGDNTLLRDRLQRMSEIVPESSAPYDAFIRLFHLAESDIRTTLWSAYTMAQDLVDHHCHTLPREDWQEPLRQAWEAETEETIDDD